MSPTSGLPTQSDKAEENWSFRTKRDPEEPIHLVANPTSFGWRAVTLHIYSRPFDTCEVYDMKAKKYADVKLSNVSEFGVLTSGLRVEKVADLGKTE